MNESLNTSELGSKSYWDDAYAREIKNHAEDAEDEGTVWFDDTGAEDKVVQLLDDLADEGYLKKAADGGNTASRFLDLGTGNGHMLFALMEEEWQGNLVGVDYSETSIRLAEQIAIRRQDEAVDSAKALPIFRQWDLLHQKAGQWLEDGFDVVLDKGTFDAISLSAESDTSGRRIHETYRECVLPTIRPAGFFIITSCNWTREEILRWFSESDAELSVFREVRYPSFTFGGQKGQSVCTIAFQRKP